jgi:hypothetical protein
MAKKINIQDDSLNQEDPYLLKKVDKMMGSSSTPDSISDEFEQDKLTAKPDAAIDSPTRDIFADTVTAPLLTKKSMSTSKDEELYSDSTEDERIMTIEAEEPVKQASTIAIKDNVVESGENNSLNNQITLDSKATTPDEYDDPKLTEVINDIVAQESDKALLVDDSLLAKAQQNSRMVNARSSHPIFWTLVALVCLVAIAIAVFLIYPNIYPPISRFNLKAL